MIKQRKIADCGVACTAMFLGITYEEALSFFPDHDFDNGGLLLSAIQDKIEKNTEKKLFINSELHFKSKGILLVPSLNLLNTCHFVYWGGPGVLLDPTNKMKYDAKYFPTVISHLLEVDQGNKGDLMKKRARDLEMLNNIKVY